MTIKQEEGNEIANKVLASWTAGFAKNNHSETMKGLFADKLTSLGAGLKVRCVSIC